MSDKPEPDAVADDRPSKQKGYVAEPISPDQSKKSGSTSGTENYGSTKSQERDPPPSKGRNAPDL